MSKITREDFNDYKKLIEQGFSQRTACTTLGLVRSTVQYYIKTQLSGDELKELDDLVNKSYETEHLLASAANKERLLQSVEQIKAKAKTGAKILAFDLETSIPKVATFGRMKVFLNHENVLEEGGKILCASYIWIDANGIGDVQLLAMTPEENAVQDDSRVCAELWELFNQADAVVCHNAATFDFPVVKTRCMMNGLPPLPTVKVLDTLIMARKNFRFPSNRLGELAAYLGLDAKKDAGGVKTWIDYQAGKQSAIDHMHYYCKHDTVLLTQVYMKLRNYGHTGSDFNAGLYISTESGTMVCPVCASTMLSTGRFVYTSVSKFDEVRCTKESCQHVARTRTNLIEDRSALVSNVKLKG